MATQKTRAAASPTATDRKMSLRKRQQEWIRAILDNNNLNYVKLADMCGFDRTTLTRLYEENSTHILRTDTVDKIAAVFGPMTPDATPAPMASTVKTRSMIEATPYASNDDIALEAIVSAIRGSRAMCNPFELKSDALTSLGYLRGDVLFVDQNAAWTDGDLVCVNLYNWDGSGAGTTFSVVRRTTDGDYLVLPGPVGGMPPAPIRVSGPTLAIMGVVTEMVRPRRLANAA